MRAVGGIILGLIVAIVGVLIVGIVAVLATFRLPQGVDAGNLGQVQTIVSMMGLATYLALAIAWLVGSLAGAWVAARVAGAAWAGWVVALLVAVYFGLNAVVLQLPPAMLAAWFLGPLLGGLLGVRLARPAAVVATEESVIEAGDAPPANP